MGKRVMIHTPTWPMHSPSNSSISNPGLVYLHFGMDEVIYNVHLLLQGFD